MVVLLVVDMQEGSLTNSDKFDVEGVITRINGLADKVRASQGKVIYIQHDGNAEENLVPGTPGWQVLESLNQKQADFYISKSTNDPFYDTLLQDKLEELGATQLIISGWATDQCVDSTVRSAISRCFEVIVAADCHTVSDRTIPAPQVITHHNGIWTHLITPSKPVEVKLAKEIIKSLG